MVRFLIDNEKFNRIKIFMAISLLLFSSYIIVTKNVTALGVNIPIPVSTSSNSSGGSSYNATYAIWAYNQTYTQGTYNSTYHAWNYNQSAWIESNYGQWFYNMSDGTGGSGTNLWGYNATNIYNDSVTRVGIGTNNPQFPFDLTGEGTDSTRTTGIISVNTYSSSSAIDRSILVMQRARGSLASPLTVSQGDRIGSFQANARSGSAFYAMAVIDFNVSGTTFTAGQRPGGMITFATGVANGAMTTRMLLDDRGTIYQYGNTEVSVNLTIGKLLRISPTTGTLGPCGANNGTIGRNQTGLLYCNTTGGWTILAGG